MAEGRPEAYITGIGVVTPIGVGRKKFWSSLLANESGAGPITLFDPENFDVRIAAECKDFDPKLELGGLWSAFLGVCYRPDLPGFKVDEPLPPFPPSIAEAVT